MSNSSISFGALLRRYRKESGQTMGDLADALGISVVYVSDVERSKRNPWADDKVIAAAACLGLDDHRARELFRAAVRDRGRVELSLDEASQLKQEVGLSLMRGWGEFTEEQLREIMKVVGPVGGQDA